MSTTDLLTALGVVAAAVSGIAGVLGVFYFLAREKSAIRRLHGLGLTISLIVLSIIIAGVLLVWLQSSKTRQQDLTASPVPVQHAAQSPPLVQSTPPQPSNEPRFTPTPTPPSKVESVLLPTPTKLDIIPVKWFVDPDGREIWDPRDCGYIDETGKWQISPQWDRAYSFSEGLALVRHNVDEGLYYIDKQSRFVMKTTSPGHGEEFSEGLAPAKDPETHGYGYIDKTGRFAIPANYYGTWRFAEGLGRVQLDEDHYGFVNHEGRLVIPAVWSNAGDVSEKLAPVCRSKKWGYIDSRARLVIPLQWGHAGPFSEGVATVKDRSGCSLVDQTGAVLVKTGFDQIGPFSNGFAIARRGEKFGFINRSGVDVTPFEWDSVIRADRQGANRRIYWNLAKRSTHGMATVVWISPDLTEIWRADLPLIPSKY